MHPPSPVDAFKEIAREAQIALFSAGRTHHEMLLIEVGGAPRPKHYVEPGLYHIGFKIGDGPESVREAYQDLRQKGYFAAIINVQGQYVLPMRFKEVNGIKSLG